MSPIPPFEGNGNLPMGRYCVTLADIRARFVDDPAFEHSPTRRSRWQGLLGYLDRWQDLENLCTDILGDRRLLRALWLGGSFASAKLDPDNVDLSVFVDGQALSDCGVMPIKGRLGKLSNMESTKQHFHVSPTLVRYRYTRSPWEWLHYKRFDQNQVDYAVLRGSFDDWWSRIRPVGEDKGPPSEDTGKWVRGYLEVILA